MNYDNPAFRLLSILKEGKDIPPATTCKGAWEKILQTEGNQALLMSRLSKVIELPQIIILAIREEFPSQGNVWSYWESRITTAFMTQNLLGQWESFIKYIDDHTMTYLSMSSTLLDTKANTKELIDDDILSIRERLNIILTEILDSEYDGEIKKFLSRKIRGIIQSIDEYKLTGALEIIDSIESAVGHAALDSNYKNFLTETPHGAQLQEILATMANIITIAAGLPQLPQMLALLTS